MTTPTLESNPAHHDFAELIPFVTTAWDAVYPVHWSVYFPESQLVAWGMQSVGSTRTIQEFVDQMIKTMEDRIDRRTADFAAQDDPYGQRAVTAARKTAAERRESQHAAAKAELEAMRDAMNGVRSNERQIREDERQARVLAKIRAEAGG